MKIRNIEPGDLDRICFIEKETFPPEEAAPREKYEYRIKNLSDFMYCMEFEEEELFPEDRGKGKKIVAFLAGRPVESLRMNDEMYENIPGSNGKTFAILSVNTLPGYQKRGIAGELINYAIEYAKSIGMENVILACKSFRKHFYESFGFECCGISESEHGGAEWYDMILIFR